MAFDLVARIKLADRFSGPMAKVEKMMRQAEKSASSASKMVAQISNNNAKAAESFRKMGGAASSSFGSIVKGAAAVTAAFGTVKMAQSMFDKTIVAAAKREMSEKTVSALFGDPDKFSKYMDYIDDRAAKSFFKQNDFFDTAKAFVPVSKDLEALRTMTELSERLAASNPEQGLAGAAFAMRELISGDSASIVERFNMPRTLINQIKDLPLKEQMKGLDKILGQMGYTQKFLEDQSTSAMAQYEQATDKVNLALQRMGKQALEKLKPLLLSFNNALDTKGMQRFVDRGSDLMAKFATSVVNGVRRAEDYIMQHFVNNAKFQNLSAQGKFEFIIQDLKRTYDAWYKAGGEAQISNIAKSVTDFAGNQIATLTKPLADAGLSLGKAAGEGILDGLTSFMKDNPLIGAGLAYVATPGPTQLKIFAAATVGAGGAAVKGTEAIDSFIRGGGARGEAFMEDQRKRLHANDKTTQQFTGEVFGGGTGVSGVSDAQVSGLKSYLSGIPGHAGGLNRVPYDNYVARLHKDERVQTKTEADATRNGRENGTTFNVSLTYNGGVGSTRDQAREMIQVVVDELKIFESAVAF